MADLAGGYEGKNPGNTVTVNEPERVSTEFGYISTMRIFLAKCIAEMVFYKFQIITGR